MKFTEAKLETAFTQLLAKEGYPHAFGGALTRTPEEVRLT
jgi:type I restriction enzyme R subunit